MEGHINAKAKIYVKAPRKAIDFPARLLLESTAILQGS